MTDIVEKTAKPDESSTRFGHLMSFEKFIVGLGGDQGPLFRVGYGALVKSDCAKQCAESRRLKNVEHPQASKWLTRIVLGGGLLAEGPWTH